MRMQSAWRMQRWVQGVMVWSDWYRTMRLMSSCWASQPDRRYSWTLGQEEGRDVSGTMQCVVMALALSLLALLLADLCREPVGRSQSRVVS